MQQNSELVRYCTEREIAKLNKRKLFHEELSRLRWKIRKTKSLSLSGISENLGYSRYSLSTLFSEYTLRNGKYVYTILYKAMKAAGLEPDPALIDA